jgi:flagellar assembly factor FliW
MNVNTARFGVVEVDDDRVITFPHGLLGFAGFTRFALLQPDDEGVFYWLQSLDTPELAFVVTDPCLWAGSYRASIRQEQMEQLQASDAEDVGILVIVNRYQQRLTANLQGPIVISSQSRLALQLVLADKRWSTRHEIARLPEPVGVPA